MAFCVTKPDGTKYWLHTRPTYSGHKNIYFFSKNPEGAVDLPEHLEVIVSARSKHPLVRKKIRG